MNKLKIFLLIFNFFLLFSFSALSRELNPFCKTSENQFHFKSDIDYIEIKINKQKKWSKNLIKAYLSPSETIQNKFKKRFKGKLVVFYKNGTKCIFDAKIRLNGDFRDHIKKINNKIFSSMNINISGHISNMRQIKLLLPETRKGDNEIFISSLLRYLDYLSPKISNVKVKIFDTEIKYLFHESVHRKEFLENMNKREGPILAEDEFFHMHPDELFKKIKIGRVRNSKWIKDNNEKFIQSSNALTKLNIFYINSSYDNFFNKASMNGTFNGYEDSFFLKKFDIYKKNLSSYDAMMMALDAYAGLGSSDVRYYYDTISESFEPIFNDGFSDILSITKKIKKSFVNSNIKNGAKESLNKINLLDVKKFHKYLLKNNLIISEKETIQIIQKIKRRLEDITLIEKPQTSKTIPKNINLNIFLKNLEKINYGYITYLPKTDNFIFCYKNNNRECFEKKLTYKEKIKILNQRYNLNNTKYIFLGDNEIFKYEKFLKKNYLTYEKNIENKFKILSNYPDEYNINFNTKEIYLNPKREDSRIIFFNGLINSWSIFVNDERKIYPSIIKTITGCTTFYKIKFINTNLSYKNSECEDAFNIIKSNGEIKNIFVENAKFDAVDFDFSEIRIKNLSIFNSGNDCLDVSYGTYIIEKSNFLRCGDKAISVGENSYLKSKNSFIDTAEIGIASKDSSRAIVEEIKIINVKNCFAAYNKKKEFDGGYIKISKHECNKFEKKTMFDNFSQIELY